jgi:hypothetical protein
MGPREGREAVRRWRVDALACICGPAKVERRWILMKVDTALLVLVLGLSATPLVTMADQQFASLSPGARVRIAAVRSDHRVQAGAGLQDAPNTAGSDRVTGSLVAIREDRIVLLVEEWSFGKLQRVDTLRVLRDELTRFELSQGRQSYVLPGMGIGLVVGAGIGILLGSTLESCADEREYCRFGGAFLGGLFGLVLGGVVGGIAATERWEEIPLDALPPELSRVVGLDTGLAVRLRF